MCDKNGLHSIVIDDSSVTSDFSSAFLPAFFKVSYNMYYLELSSEGKYSMKINYQGLVFSMSGVKKF